MNIRRMALTTAIAIGLSAGAGLTAAPQTWTGKISDSMCGAKHMSMGGKNQTDKSCTVDCVKEGDKYILVVGTKTMKIANQTFKDLAKFAGDAVTVTGELKGDTITVTKVEAVPVKK